MKGSATTAAAVAAGAGKRDAEGGGHGGLRPAGVRRAMARRVLRHDAEGLADGAADSGCDEGDERAGEPACGEIDQIVEPCRSPAEIAVARGAVADH